MSAAFEKLLGEFRTSIIEIMEKVRDEKRPGVTYHLIPDFADAIAAHMKQWEEER